MIFSNFLSVIYGCFQVNKGFDQMKGISHFLAGLAAATFIPGVVESAAQGSYLILLGGLFGLLPDTLDFKFARYFDRAEAIDPDPANLDPQVDCGPDRCVDRSGGGRTT